MYSHLIVSLNQLAKDMETVDRQAQILELCDSDNDNLKELGRSINSLAITVNNVLSRQ